MTEYTSKQVQINKPDSIIYEALGSFENFSPMLKDKVEDWNATDDTCSFKAKGFTLKLRMIEKTPYSTIKITGEDMPFEFLFWIQLKQVEESKTVMRLVAKANLNAMLKMMLGKKLEEGLNQLAEQIAKAFNSR